MSENLSSRKYIIVCNPNSGKGLSVEILPKLKQKLSALNINYDVCFEKLPHDLNGYTDLIIMGGDGTINHVLNHFETVPVPISIISSGTGNDFATMIFGKKTLDDLIHNAVHGKVHVADMAVCNGIKFLNGFGVGFDGAVVKKMLSKKVLSGHAAYLATVISLLFSYKETAFKIYQDDVELVNEKGFMVTVANGQMCGGGFKVAPKAIINDQVLDFIFIKKINPLKRMINLPKMEKGKHLSLPFVNFKTVKNIKIVCDKIMPAHLDGEYIEAKEFAIHILEKAIQLRY